MHGDGKLTSLIRQEAFDAAKGQVLFARRLAEAAGDIEPAGLAS